jgi:hypothetical protein
MNVTDYVAVRERLDELGWAFPSAMAILPANFDSKDVSAEALFPSEAATLKALFRNNNIPIVELLPPSERRRYIQNNSADWLAPALFISAALVIENPTMVSIALNVLSNYLSDFFKGMPGKAKTVKLRIIVEKTSDGSCSKVSYEGDLSGLDGVAQIVQKISNNE